MSNPVKKINLALQGGGAHGAFTWGVLDRLLEDDSIEIDGICACSAGTMNAIAYAYGMILSGKQGARDKMAELWKKVSQVGQVYNPSWNPVKKWLKYWGLESFFFESLIRTLSPYQYNPLDINPLKQVIGEVIDFRKLRCSAMKLFVSTTNVQTGKVDIFHTPEITIEVALASACLPFFFKTVEINGSYHWDGGYMGNPVLFPLFYHVDSHDIVIVHIDPIQRMEIPKTAAAITNRIHEISFNSSLIKELRAVAFVQKLLEEGWIKDEYQERLRYMYIHSIPTSKITRDLHLHSKFNIEWGFLTKLRDEGREIAGKWLKKNYDNLGKRNSVDLRKEFLDFDHEESRVPEKPEFCSTL